MASKIKVDQIQTADGSGTIALQNQLSGMTTASLPTGSVLQVVSITSNTVVTVTSSSYVDVSISTAITPSSTSSKIFVVFNGAATTYGSSASSTAQAQIVRGSTALISHRYGDYHNSAGNDNNYYSGVTIAYLDSPSTTSATTYKIQAKTNGCTNTIYEGTNGTSTLTLMEIAG